MQATTNQKDWIKEEDQPLSQDGWPLPSLVPQKLRLPEGVRIGSSACALAKAKNSLAA
jgi:hypothetical protein